MVRFGTCIGRTMVQFDTCSGHTMVLFGTYIGQTMVLFGTYILSRLWYKYWATSVLMKEEG